MKPSNPKFQDAPSTIADVKPITPQPSTPEVDALRKLLAEQRDLNVCLSADFENFKRRNRQEADTRADAQKESFIHEL